MPHKQHGDDMPVALVNLSSEGISFGEYLRSVRKAKDMTIDDIAKAVGKTKVYISDIERGNNLPPDEPLLTQIIAALGLDGFEKIVDNLNDLAGVGRGSVAPDIAKYIMSTSTLRSVIRKGKQKEYKESDWQRVSNLVK